MSRVEVQFLDQGLHRALFDAMPMPVFLVDQDVSILEYNSAAAKYLGQEKPAVLERRCGEVLHCIRAGETPGGCGRAPMCANCVVRQSVQSAFKGEHVNRRRANMEVLAGGKQTKLKVQVSCRPVNYEQHSFALLILEGLNES
jgi:PAS domain-containing protein